MTELIQAAGLPGLITAGCVLLLAAAAVTALAARGVLRVDVKGVKIGAPGKEDASSALTRGTLARIAQHIDDMTEYMCQYVVNELSRSGIPELSGDGGMMRFRVDFVCEKMRGKMLQWLLLNNIADTPEYRDAKAEEAYQTVIAAVGRMNVALAGSAEFLGAMKRVCAALTADFVRSTMRLKSLG